MYSDTCHHQPWQNVIDQSYVHGSKKSQQNDQGQYYQTPWQGQQDWQAHWQSTSARGRTPSPRPRQRPKKCKREQDAQESTAGCTTDATYDDAGHATQCIPWTSSTSSTSSTEASNVSSADDAVPYAGDIAAAATSRHTMASTTSTVYGQDASLDACPHDLSNHADNASSCDAENACRTSTFGNRYGRRSAGPYVYDEGKTGGTSTGHATESAESSDQIWSTNLYGSTCRSDSPGQCKSKLRRSSPGQKSAPRHVEEVPLRRSATLTELRGAVHGPGEKAPGAGEHPQGVAHRSQAKPVEKSKVAKLDSGEVQNITSDEETEDQEASNATNAVTILTETMEGQLSLWTHYTERRRRWLRSRPTQPSAKGQCSQRKKIRTWTLPMVLVRLLARLAEYDRRVCQSGAFVSILLHFTWRSQFLEMVSQHH